MAAIGNWLNQMAVHLATVAAAMPRSRLQEEVAQPPSREFRFVFRFGSGENLLKTAWRLIEASPPVLATSRTIAGGPFFGSADRAPFEA